MFYFIAWRVTLRFRKLLIGGLFGSFLITVSYTERTPRPTNPLFRPQYQGSNPLSDIFALWALRSTIKYLPRIHKYGSSDHEAREQMLYVQCQRQVSCSIHNLELAWLPLLLVLVWVMRVVIYAMR